MEAKDTLINFGGAYGDGSLFEEILPHIKKACQAQAEISFKAGVAKGKVLERTAIGNMAERAVEQGKRAGIREVVEWVESHEKSTCMDCSCAFAFRNDEWQAKLKEWRDK